jgi:hypothetical protein
MFSGIFFVCEMTQPFVVQIYGKKFHPKITIDVQIEGKVHPTAGHENSESEYSCIPL